MKIEYSELEAIKQVNLPEIIKDYGITLKETHRESFQCLCPFHDDKNPSLHISRKNDKWIWNCFGCHTSGNVLDFVIKYEKLSFAEAYKKLTVQSPRFKVQSEGETAKEETKPVMGFNRQELLKRVTDFYHQTFLEDKRGIEYLAKRGIRSEEVYRSFKIGYANGSLRGTLPANEDNEIIRILKETGILNQKGNEHFYNCVVFPIYDENDCIAGIYGRNILNFNPLHLYLPGPHKGVWNYQSLKLSREIVLTESIIDALSCYVLGAKNVVPLYGVNGLTEDHIHLFREHRTEKVSLCFDNDEPGAAARERIKEKLIPLGIEVADIVLPAEYKDINEMLQKGRTDFSFKAIKAAGAAADNKPSGGVDCCENPKVEKKDDAIYVSFNQRSYRIRGLGTKNLERMRVNIKVQDGEQYHLDTLDLYSSKSRAIFTGQCRKMMKATEDDLSRELNRIVTELENIQAESLDIKGPVEAKKMSAEEEREAMEQLKSPGLLEDILNDVEKIGYVGEDANKAIGYLVAISRKLEDPLSCVIISQSSAGKSALAEVVEKLVPAEECLMYSRITPQALYYMDKDALKRKLLMIEESTGAEAADYSIRTLQSKKKLTQAVPIKDPNTGRIRTVSFEVEGPVAYIETTTRPRINQENATRCFELYLDESREQTRRIQEAQKASKTLGGLSKNIEREQIIKKHQNMQRCLRQVRVVNPFAHLLEFPSEWLRTRRDNLRFLNLIEVITFLYQHQREVKRTEGGPASSAGRLEYIESNMADYKTAYLLAREVLGESFTELKKPQRELLGQIENLLDKKEETTRREIREHTGLPDHRLRDLLAELVSLEYLGIVEGKQGKSYHYKLAERGISGAKIFVGLTSPEDLAQRINSEAVYPPSRSDLAELSGTSPLS
jgi:DNA primase catalytic core